MLANKLTKIWNRISHYGVDTERKHELREVILSNRVVFIGIMMVLCFIPVEIYFNGFTLVPVEIFFAGLFALVFPFHKKGYYLLAKYYIVLFTVAMICLMTLAVGGESGSEYMLISIMVTPMVLFKERKHMLVMTAVVVLSLFLLKHFAGVIPPLVEVSLNVRHSVQPYMLIMGLIILFFQVYYFKSLNTSYQELLVKHRHLLEEKNKEIRDSIIYAKRIQNAVLTPAHLINEHLPQNFILFKPKDIVAGDFYWAEAYKGLFYLCTADCTGHGVPGAFMSLLNIGLLNENVIERGIRLPNDILNEQRKEIIKALNPKTEDNAKLISGLRNECVMDGMDCVLAAFDTKNHKLYFATANNPLIVIRNGELTEYKAQKMPVGLSSHESTPFELQSIDLQKGDMIYTFSDGYPDQFGQNGKKFMSKNLKDLFKKICPLSMPEQKTQLEQHLQRHMGQMEQTDDILVIGVRY